MGIFEKNLVTYTESSTKAQAGSTGVAGAVNSLGLTLKDANGAMLPLNDLMLEVADKFAAMPDGAEKTADAMALFGKSGKDLIPILDLGSAGLQEAMDDANKYGLTLTGANVDAVRAFGLAHKDLDEAMEGVTLQLGAALMPALATGAETLVTLAQGFNQDAIPALKGFGDAVNLALGGDVKGALDALGPAMAGALVMIKDQLGGWTQAFVGWVAPMIPPFLVELGTLAGEFAGWIGDQMPAITAQLAVWGQAFIAWIEPMIPPFLGELASILGSLVNWAVTTALPGHRPGAGPVGPGVCRLDRRGRAATAGRVSWRRSAARWRRGWATKHP